MDNALMVMASCKQKIVTFLNGFLQDDNQGPWALASERQRENFRHIQDGQKKSPHVFGKLRFLLPTLYSKTVIIRCI